MNEHGFGGHPFRQVSLKDKGFSGLGVLSPTNSPTIEQKRVEIRLRKLRLNDPAAYLRKVELAARRGVDIALSRSDARFLRKQKPRAPRVAPLPDLSLYDQQRLWEKIERRGPDECWPWTAAVSGDGYGRFKIGGKLYSPHRVVHAITAGPITDVPEYHGSVVMHRCDNPSCCNPAHLRLGTQADNVVDMDRKGRRRSPRFGSLPPLPTAEVAR